MSTTKFSSEMQFVNLREVRPDYFSKHFIAPPHFFLVTQNLDERLTALCSSNFICIGTFV